MALMRKYRDTVLERIRKDPEFTAALYAEAITSLMDGDRVTALSILRDLVHAHISFKRLSEQTGFDEKSLHRMLGSGGNPTMENLSLLLSVIEKDLRLNVRIAVERRGNRPSLRKGVPHPAPVYA